MMRSHVVEDLVTALEGLPGITKVSVDAPTIARGSYFIDLTTGTQGFVIEYRADSEGFGLSSLPSDGFTSPDEFLADQEKLIARIRELIITGARTDSV